MTYDAAPAAEPAPPAEPSDAQIAASIHEADRLYGAQAVGDPYKGREIYLVLAGYKLARDAAPAAEPVAPQPPPCEGSDA